MPPLRPSVEFGIAILAITLVLVVLYLLWEGGD